MSFCGHCLSHGIKTSATPRHANQCLYSSCSCDKCAAIVVNGLNGGQHSMTIKVDTNGRQTNGYTVIDVNGLNTRPMIVNTNDDNHVFVPKTKPSLPDVWPTRPLETVRQLADELSKIDTTDEIIQKSVIYAVLENNDFSIDGTTQLLEEARRAITESLVLPAFDDNRQIRLKRRMDSDEESSEESFNRVFKRTNTAKKSFPMKALSLCRRSLRAHSETTNGHHLPNSAVVKTIDTSVQTNERLLEKCEQRVTSSPIVISPKLLVSTQSQTDMTNIPKTPFSPTYTPTVPQNSVLVSQLRRPVAIVPKPPFPVNPNTILTINKQSSYMLMPLVSNSSVIVNSTNPNVTPIQVQIPGKAVPQVVFPMDGGAHPNGQTIIKATPSSNTSIVTLNAGPISSSVLTSPLKSPNSCAPRFIRLSTPSTHPAVRLTELSSNLSQEKLRIRKRGQNVFIRNPAFKSFNPNMAYNSAFGLNMTDPTNGSMSGKLCAKVITSEAALEALTAFSDATSNSSYDTSKTGNDFDVTAEMIVPDGSDDSVDTVLIKESTPATDDLKTSKSNKLLITSTTTQHSIIHTSPQRLFSHRSAIGSKNSTLISPNVSIKSNKANKNDDIIQITIDD